MLQPTEELIGGVPRYSCRTWQNSNKGGRVLIPRGNSLQKFGRDLPHVEAGSSTS